MKKSILALGAVAVIGGLGLATTAQAVSYFGPGLAINNTQAPAANSIALGNLGTTFQAAGDIPALSTAGATPTTFLSTNVLATAGSGLQLNAGSIGHELIVPYYSVQGATNTLLSIVNTDRTNGKVVKVRFRGAANSDDVLDFTVFLSPADVWTATVTQGSDGLAHLSSNDQSCAQPSNSEFADVPFSTSRFPSYLSGAQVAANTLEGYIEILNMADVPPAVPSNTAGTGANLGTLTANSVWVTNALYTAIKHVGGTPPCAAKWATGNNQGTDALAALLDNVVIPPSPAGALQAAGDYGLASPTGGLLGGWMLINQQTLAQFSGNDVAVRAVSGAATATAQAPSAATDIVISPQQQIPTPTGVTVAQETADPLLTGYATVAPPVAALDFDLPDLSTPFDSLNLGLKGGLVNTAIGTFQTPTAQSAQLALALSKGRIVNEFVNDPNGTVPMSTDWVISQPTRRYFAVVNYGKSADTSAIIYNDGWTSNALATPAAAALYTGPTYSYNATLSRYTAANLPLPYAGQSGVVSTALSTGGANGTGAGTGSLTLQQGANGPVACLYGSFGAIYDREETSATVGASFSPGVNAQGIYCGEVATATWGTSPVGASLTNTPITSAYKSGWAILTPNLGTVATVVNGDLTTPANIPFVGFAAESVGNLQSGVTYGATLPHRW